jgi:hypothetical protein
MMNKVSLLTDKKDKILVPIDDKNGYLVHENVLRFYAANDKRSRSLGDGTTGSHNIFLKHLVRDYVRIYRKLEEFGEL